MSAVLGAWYDLRDLANLSHAITGWIDGWGPHWLAEVAGALLGSLGILSVAGVSLLALIWVERKVIARMQARYGPNRVGPRGLFQPVADAAKLILKEELAPRAVDRLIFLLPPVLLFIPALLVWGVLPFSVRMSLASLEVGVLFLVAITSLNPLFIFMAGWASNNKYALFGAMRVVAMSISYEVPMVLSLLTVVMFTGTMNISEIVLWQRQEDLPLVLLLPLTAFTFTFAATAELNRTPIDIAEAESEIVAGYHTEYSGMRFGLFYAVELLNTLTVSAFIATFFFGGWWLWGLDRWLPPWLILFAKASVFYFLFIWLRGTLPRFRLDQLMAFGWKFLAPTGLAFLVVAAVERTLLIETEWDTTLALPIMAVLNLGITAGLGGLYARRMSRSDALRAEAPRMAGGRIGGLRMARELAGAGGGD